MQLATARYYDTDRIIESGLLPVGITLSPPRFAPKKYGTAASLRMLAPDGIEWGLEHDEFTRLYRDRLDSFGVDRIMRVLDSLVDAHDAPGIVFLCYEKPGEFCHRHVLAEWLEEQTGEKVAELGQLAIPTGLLASR